MGRGWETTVDFFQPGTKHPEEKKQPEIFILGAPTDKPPQNKKVPQIQSPPPPRVLEILPKYKAPPSRHYHRKSIIKPIENWSEKIDKLF